MGNKARIAGHMSYASLVTLFTVSTFYLLPEVVAVGDPHRRPGPHMKSNPFLKIHVVFGNHLDVGYGGLTDEVALDHNVINTYFHQHFPRAAELAKQMQQMSSNDRFIYTTHAWLLSLFFDCPGNTVHAAETAHASTEQQSGTMHYTAINESNPNKGYTFTQRSLKSSQASRSASHSSSHNHIDSTSSPKGRNRISATSNQMGLLCPSIEEQALVADAIRVGHITWHANPFNGQAEVFDRDLFSFGMQLAHDLDDRFGLPRKRSWSQRDIPGMTRGVIPLLAKEGVQMITVGVNAASAPPSVPQFVPFIWRHEGTGTQVLAMWHPGGYGGTHYGPGYTVNVDSKSDCIRWPGFDHVLCVAWRNDNTGPPDSIYEVAQVLTHLRDEFPGATVMASSFEAYAEQLIAAAPGLNLPVFSEELGDSWVYGTASDPIKHADFRAAMRARRSCLANGECDMQDPAFQNFSRLLMKAGEHTWGLAVQVLDDWATWSNTQLQEKLLAPPPGYQLMLESWRRQAAYVGWALEALGPSHPISKHVLEDHEQRLPRLTPLQQHIPGLQKLLDSNQPGKLEALPVLRTRFWELQIDARTGGLKRLQRVWQSDHQHFSQPGLGTDWAGDGSSFAVPMYSTYTELDFQDVLLHHYSYHQPPWYADFGKPNVSSARPVRADLYGMLKSVHVSEGTNDLKIYTEHAFPAWCSKRAGAPEFIWTTYTLSDSNPTVTMEVSWFNKTATRLPEALWLQFKPGQGAVDISSWTMHKLGGDVLPLEVIRNGSYSQHAVQDEGVSVRAQQPLGTAVGAWETLHVQSLDAPIVSPGRPWALPNVDKPPEMEHGISYNLVNNVFGTNFIFWYPYGTEGDNLNFRFSLDVSLEVQQHTGLLTF